MIAICAIQITDKIINDSVVQRPFGSFEPFIAGTDHDVQRFYSDVLDTLAQVSEISVRREIDHRGSGYASYVEAFLYPSDGSTQSDQPGYVETTGILLYMSRLAPIAVYGASGRTDNKDQLGSTSGFINVENVGTLPEGDWTKFLEAVTCCLAHFRIEFLPIAPC